MTARTLTLSDFLLARIAEVEATAKRAQREMDIPENWTFGIARPLAESGAPPLAVMLVGMMNPERVLAECGAKRRIVDECRGQDEQGPSAAALADVVLRSLALPFADHPDYDEAWRP